MIKTLPFDRQHCTDEPSPGAHLWKKLAHFAGSMTKSLNPGAGQGYASSDTAAISPSAVATPGRIPDSPGPNAGLPPHAGGAPSRDEPPEGHDEPTPGLDDPTQGHDDLRQGRDEQTLGHDEPSKWPSDGAVLVAGCVAQQEPDGTHDGLVRALKEIIGVKPYKGRALAGLRVTTYC